MWLLGKARYRISDLTGYRISDLTESRISVFLFALNIFKKHSRTFSFFQVDKCHIRPGIPQSNLKSLCYPVGQRIFRSRIIGPDIRCMPCSKESFLKELVIPGGSPAPSSSCQPQHRGHFAPAQSAASSGTKIERKKRFLKFKNPIPIHKHISLLLIQSTHTGPTDKTTIQQTEPFTN